MNGVTATAEPVMNQAQDSAPDALPPAESRASLSALQARIATLESELARLQRTQAAIAQGLSHDVRAPLRAIDGFAMQLAREVTGDNAAEQLAKIRAAAARMGSLTEALLEYSRVARAELRDDEVDLAFLADWALMDLQSRHPAQQIVAEVQSGLRTRGDERLLRVLFDQLLDNCRKFAVPGQPVSLRVEGEACAEGLHLCVSDAGIGMELRHETQPFEPFMRLHGSREGSGHGLGLAIAEAVVQRHGGRIWMVSTPGQGCTVHMLLPQHASASAQA